MSKTGKHGKHGKLGLWIGVGILVVSIGIAGFWARAFINRADHPVQAFLNIHALAVTPGTNPIVYVSTRTGLIRIDTGARWRWVGTNRDDMAGFALALSEPNTMYVSGRPIQDSRRPDPVGLRVSRDAGERWENVSLVGEVNFSVLAVSPSDPALLYGWFRDQLYVSEDAGLTWEMRTPALLVEAGGVRSLAVHPSEPGQLLAGTQHGVAQSRDAGLTWEYRNQEGAARAVAFDPSDGQRLFAFLDRAGGGVLVESRDGGETWSDIAADRFAEDPVTHIAVQPSDPNVVYVGTQGPGLYVSRDGGRSWTVLARGGNPLSAR